MITAALAVPIGGEWAIAVLAKRWMYGYKLNYTGRAEDGAASSTSTTMWWEDEIKKLL